jgi:hypothetical protein
MCHRKLGVVLCRNVLYPVRTAREGRSLAAIQICLGAGARRTNRAET